MTENYLNYSDKLVFFLDQSKPHVFKVLKSGKSILEFLILSVNFTSNCHKVLLNL